MIDARRKARQGEGRGGDKKKKKRTNKWLSPPLDLNPTWTPSF
jgi:hypothetical protein